MAMVTAAVRAGGVPLRRVFVEHRGAFGVSLGWTLTDGNGSFTFDAGLGFDRVDVRVHGRNSVVRVVDDSDLIPGTAHIFEDLNVATGDVVDVGSFAAHFAILAQAQDVYDTVWRQFRPYNRDSRGAFPLGRKPGLRDTFAESPTCEIGFPDRFPVAILTFVEPVGVFNGSMPIVHLKPEGRLFGTATDDPSLLPHELGHVFTWAAQTSGTRTVLESSYLAYLATQWATGGALTHSFPQTTSPLVAWIEAGGIFSERFFFFAKRVAPQLTGGALRTAFVNDELATDRSLPGVLVDAAPRAAIFGTGLTLAPGVPPGRRPPIDPNILTRRPGQPALPTMQSVTPSLTGNDVEGAVYGAVYLDFGRRVGLREAVGLVIDSNATTFAEFQAYVHGRGNDGWTIAIDAIAAVWGM
jgi:hypothetical protein